MTLSISAAPAEPETTLPVGVAKVDITPAYPIRLSGYAVRKKESDGIAQHLFAKALAIGSDKDGPAVLLTVDNTGVPAAIRGEVVARLQKKKGLDPARIALCSSHSHAAPCLAGNLPTLFGEPLPPEHQAHVERYTHELVDALEQVALAALKDRRPARLSWAQTQAGFAANRRTAGGPVDHDLPFLAVHDLKGQLRALLFNYACHCTTLGGGMTQVCGDWAGYAQEYLEQDHPGAIVLAAIGCGADANPKPAGTLEFAKQHGREIGVSVEARLGHTLLPLAGPLTCRAKSIELPFDTLPTRVEWERKATQTNYEGYYARVNLAKLDRGESLLTRLPYLVSTWTFGDDLTMVFLPGEVVVDYALRLKQEFDRTRLWINAYANDVPCYIPSERILREGGYEGGGAMVYYDKPTRLAPGIENLIIHAVRDLVPTGFRFDVKQAEFPPPRSAGDSLASIQTEAGLEVQLVAAEPQVVSPVAIDWGADGKLWVVEMRDYPMGMDGHWKPGSRVRLLRDQKSNGRYNGATVFLDDLPFATGVTAWGKGALICAAPDILYAEDIDGDGRADVVIKVFTGFATDNYQARVNSLSLGLDNWIYGANGLLGGVIHGVAPPLLNKSTTVSSRLPWPEVDIRGRDFRFRPESCVFEPASGLTQQGRVRDDFGNWFGCDNSTLGWHYPIPDHYVRRNSHVAAPSPRVAIAAGADANLLHPASRTLERFNQPQSANRVTSACGLGFYRDVLLGDEFYGNAFVCEPVHNLIHRLALTPEGVTFSGRRTAREQAGEFLASLDNWFRPVQARTGPDGALWVVDMYRFVVEHPRWIPAERLAKLDVRAGADMGRIYRIVPSRGKLRPIQDLTRLSPDRLAAALETPNGTERDRVHLELLRRQGTSAVRSLEKLANESKLAAVRLQALCVLDGLRALRREQVEHALKDRDAGVRANAVRLSEHWLGTPEAVARADAPLDALTSRLLALTTDSDPIVRFQLALSLGEWPAPAAGKALADIARNDFADPWFRAAILSSSMPHSPQLLEAALAIDPSNSGRTEMIQQLLATIIGAGDSAALARAINAVAEPPVAEAWQFAAVNGLLDALDRKGVSLANLDAAPEPALRAAATRLRTVFKQARELAGQPAVNEAAQAAAIRTLGREPENLRRDVEWLARRLDQPLSPPVQRAVFAALRHCSVPEVPALLLQDWPVRTPLIRQASLEVLLSREGWTQEALSALDQGVVARTEISLADRQRLLHHKQAIIRQSAEKLWPSGGSGSRAQVVAQYQSAITLSGEAARGGQTFGKLCATCHFLRGQGYAVGPNLAALADKTPADFLTAILDPNAVVEPRFVAYNLETRDGRSLTGVVSAETGTTLTLTQSGGEHVDVLRSEVREIRASGLSLMPEGLEQTLSPQDLADLIAYLKSSPRPFGSATPQQAEAAKKQFLSGGANGVAKLVGASEQLPYPSWLGELPMPHCRQTDGRARLEWQSQPVPADLKPDTVYQFRLAAAMGFASQPAGRFTLRLNGQAVLEFGVALADETWQSTDSRVRMSYTVIENNSEDSNGVLTIAVAGSLLEPGRPAVFAVTGSATDSQRWFGVYLLQGNG